jgi:hypothetical protein
MMGHDLTFNIGQHETSAGCGTMAGNWPSGVRPALLAHGEPADQDWKKAEAILKANICIMTAT